MGTILPGLLLSVPYSCYVGVRLNREAACSGAFYLFLHGRHERAHQDLTRRTGPHSSFSMSICGDATKRTFTMAGEDPAASTVVEVLR
jgi:hypothetical protein